jgi:hypothetical protein
VRAFPELDSKWRVSTEGGTEPLWSPNGRELFYRQEAKMMVVRFENGDRGRPTEPRLLFEGEFEENSFRTLNYDVTPDGNSFVMIKRVDESTSPRIHVVLNWHQELLEKVPVK